MSDSMKLKVSARKNAEGGETFEGTVTLPVSNLAPARVQKADGTTKFATRSGVVQAANSAAKKLGYTVAEDQPAVKKAAKKSTSKKATKKSSTPKVTNPT